MDMTLFLISLAVGVVIGLIVVNVMRSQLKTVRQQVDAGNYINPGSLHLTQSQDVYLYQTTTRHPRPKQKSQK